MKSSTYYSSIDSGGNKELDLGGKPIPVSDRTTRLADADSRMPVSVEASEEDRRVAATGDDSVPAETVDKVYVAQPKKDKLSEKFRKWHEGELKLYSDSDRSERSSPRHSVDEQANAGWNEVSRPDEIEAGSVASDEKEGEPNMLSGRGHETLDLTDDMLRRNLAESGRSDEYDMFEDPDGTGSKIVDAKDEEQDIDFSQVVERNRFEEKPPDSQPFSEQLPFVDRVDHVFRRSSKRGIFEDLPQPQKESVGNQLEEKPSDSEVLSEQLPFVERVDHIVRRSSKKEIFQDLSQPEKESVSTGRQDLDLEGPAESGDVLDSRYGPVVETRRFGEKIGEPEERVVRPEQLEREEQLQTMARDVDALQQEVDTTVNSRELETTDEIVVETKVTEVKTVLMHLGESGDISVMETTEVKTDTDMKETKKILERDEVAVSHRRQPDFLPLSPSPSPAGSFRSRTPDRHSPPTSLVLSDSVEKLVEADLAEVRDAVIDIRPTVGVDAGLYVAICPYEPETEDVMSLHEGEFLEILEDTAYDWWLVKKSFDGREGYVPAQYLRDKHADDRMVEEEVAKQLDKVYVDSSKKNFSGSLSDDN